MDDFERFKKEIQEALAAKIQETVAAENEKIPAPAKLKTHVAEALANVRKEETAEKWRGSTEKQLANLEQSLGKMQSRLNLNSFQVNEMRKAMTDRHARTQELIRQWEVGVADEVLGQSKQDDHQRYQADLTRILTPEQLQTHRQGRGNGGRRGK